jgi:hypothetical protein
MILITTQAEFLELVEELRWMATAAPTAKIRDALTRIADRYAARAERRSGNHRMRNNRAVFAQVTAPPTRGDEIGPRMLARIAKHTELTPGHL